MKRFCLIAGVLLLLATAGSAADAFSSAGFRISGLAATTPINNDSTVNIPVSVTPVNGFTGGVDLKCALGSMPPGAVNLPICNFPIVLPTVTIAGAASAHTQLSVATAGKALPGLATGNSRKPGDSQYLALIIFPAALLLLRLHPAEFAKKRSLLLCLLLIAAFLGTGCGGGSMAPKTTPGTYTFQIHGTDASTGRITASATVTVNVE